MSPVSRRLGLLLLLLLLPLAAFACPDSDEASDATAERARSDAVLALEQGRAEAALAAIAAFRANRPDTPDALLEVSALLVRAGEAAEARWLLEDAVERFPERHDLKLALAGAALLVGHPAQAERVAEAIPDDAEEAAAALLIRSRAAMRLGDAERALAILRAAEARYPDEAEIRLPRISALLEQRRFEDARRAIATADAEITSDEGRAALRRLQTAALLALAGEGDADAAIEGIQALLDEAPDDAAIWSALVQLELRLGRGKQARARLVAALARDHDELFLYPLLANVDLALGDVAAAEDWLRTLIERSPSPSAHLALAQLQLAREDDAVLADLDSALREFPDSEMLRIARIEALLRFGRLEQARSELAEFATARGESPQSEYLRARIELEDGEAAAAVARLRDVVPLLDEATTQYWLARALEASGDVDGALRRYGLAFVRNPSDGAAALAIVRISLSRGDFRSAAAHARKLLQHSPANEDAWSAFVTALIELGDVDGALAASARALSVLPERATSQLLRGAALRAAGRLDEALASLRSADDRYGPDATIAAEIALTLARQGAFEDAFGALDAGRAHDPDAPVLLRTEAMLHFLAGDAAAGADATDRALAQDPGDLRPLRGRAEFRAATGELAGARADCERLLAARPDDARIRFVLGSVLARSGEVALAAAEYRRAAELDPVAVAPRNNLAELLAESGDLDGALEAAQQAFALAEHDPFVLDTLGALYLRKGLVDRSISLLEEAHATAPGLHDARLHLAQAYLGAGRNDDARAMLAPLQRDATLAPALRREVDATLAAMSGAAR